MENLPEPIARFAKTFERAGKKSKDDHTSAALATADAAARPAVRMVLLKGFDAQGFIFYTNYGSRKAREMDENPRAALCFHWWSIDEQVRIEGRVEKIEAGESDRYFATRSRLSQLGAWASRQSAPLNSRFSLLRRLVRYQARFSMSKVPRPDFWGGYRLIPQRMEFWINRADRLHDRLAYIKSEEGEWEKQRLYP